MSIINPLPYNIVNGQAIDATPVMANFNEILNDVNANAAPTATVTALAATVSLKAASGANSDITSLTGLTTAISVAQGGTGAITTDAARRILELNRPIMRCAITSGTPATTNGASTPCPFNTAQYDNRGWFNAANGRYTPQINGYYEVMGSIGVSMGGLGEMFAGISVNGGEVCRGARYGGQTSNAGAAFHGIVGCNGTTDYITAYFYCNVNSTTFNSDAAGAITWMSIRLVQAA